MTEYLGPSYPWMLKAQGELGQAEIPGSRHNPRVLMYHQSTKLRASDDETPWCAAFVSWCLPDGGTKNAWARSYVNYGTRLDVPRYGCVVILERGADSGHVGFYVGQYAGRILLLGGNQNNRVCIADFDPARVLGYRWPE